MNTKNLGREILPQAATLIIGCERIHCSPYVRSSCGSELININNESAFT